MGRLLEYSYSGLVKGKCQVQSLNHIIKDKSNSLIERNFSSSNSLIDTNRLIERVLKENADIIEQQWVKRHAKYCYAKGIPAYMELIYRARKYGNNPTSLLGYLVNKELSHNAQ